MNDEKFNQIVEGKAKNVTIGENGNIVQNNNATQKFYEQKQKFNTNTYKKSGLPKEILESFQKTPPISTIPSTNEIINETVYPNNSIDYSMIKDIVNECLNSQFNQIKNALINESTVKGFTIKNGNKIQFLTKNGDLYEGELKLKKRKEK